MVATIGTSGFGTRLYRGDGGVGSAVKASRTIGAADTQVVYTAVQAGTGGNNISVAQVVSGNSTPLTVNVVGNTITVNLATDGGGLATSRANDVVAAIYDSTAARALVDASNGAGNGTGVAVAGAAGNLAGGTAGVELFTEIAEITNLGGPDETLELIDATHMGSPGGRREFIPSLKDSGEVTLDLNFLPGDANQNGLRQDLIDRVRRTFKLVWTDLALTTYTFSGYVTSHTKSAAIDDKLTASVTIKITGDIQLSTGGA